MSRPKKGNITVSFRLSPTIIAKLDDLHVSSRKDKSEIVESALKTYMNKLEIIDQILD